MTASLHPDRPAGRWRLRLEVDEPESVVATAVDDDGAMIGLATAGVTRDHDAATQWELYSINVTAEQQGSGLADDLIQVSTRDGDASVWVRRENERARGFYERHGFSSDGATTADPVTGACEIRMVRRSADR